MLSVLTITWHPLSEGRKWISARKTDLSARQFMCQERNSPVQTLHAGLPSKTAPQPVKATARHPYKASGWSCGADHQSLHPQRNGLMWSNPHAWGGAWPWGLRACDKCLRRHDGLAWSGLNVYWGWKSRQEPDGPAFERNPSELPKTQFVEKGREHSSWCSFRGQDHECDEGQHPCDGSLTPWNGPECSIHALCECSRCQSQAKGKNLVLVSLPSKSEPNKLPVPPNDLNMKIGIFLVDSDKPVSHSNTRHNSLQRQHLELPFVKGEVQMMQVQNRS